MAANHVHVVRAAPDPTPLPWEDLSSVISERLRDEGIKTIEEWRELGERRYQVFGLLRSMVVQVDRAVAENKLHRAPLITRNEPARGAA